MCYEEGSTEREAHPMQQQTFAEVSFEQYRKSTRRERFLDEMTRVVPWAELVAVIEPVYPKADGPGRPPVGIERMLRLHCLQQWFNLSDPAVEEALYDSRAMRQFVGIDLGREPGPDETTICKFRHLLEAHQIGAQLFARIGAHLATHGLKVSHGTIVDATIISAPSSTKNRTKERDPEMHQTNQEGQSVVFRHEGPYWRGQPDQADSFSGRDRRPCA
jgi:IS5 family transposase